MALATPIAPRQQTPYGVVEELLPAGGVPRDAVVMVLPTACGVQPLEPSGPPAVATLLTPRGEARERGPELLPGGPACEGLAPRALLSPPPLEPQHLAARVAGLAVPTDREEPGLGA